MGGASARGLLRRGPFGDAHHPEFQDLKVGDLVDYGGGNLVPVHQIEPFKHLVHAEAFVLKPLPRGRTRLIVRYRGTGFISPALHNIAPDAPLLSRAAAFIVVRVPGVDLLARALDFFVSDPLHHYMEVGMLKGIKARVEGAFPVTKSPADSGHGQQQPDPCPDRRGDGDRWPNTR